MVVSMRPYKANEVERARDQNVAVDGFRRPDAEARATDERRVLERQGHVVERVEKQHALVGGHPRIKRIRLKGQRLRGELSPPWVGQAAIEVVVANAAVVVDGHAREPDRNVARVFAPELLLARDHRIPKQPAVCGADGFG